MPGQIPAARRRLIDGIAARAPTTHGLPANFAQFVNAYYHGVDEADLRARDPAAFAVAAAAHQRFGAKRPPGRSLVRVFNPTMERDGWECSQTIVEVVTDDMPFLVDSLGIVLNSCDLSVHTMVHPVLPVRRDRNGRLLEVPAEGAGTIA
jgi:glutamate dehydrogenase